MNKSLRRRVAAVATTATVGGLLLPFLAAGSAAAAPITALTVTPTSANSSTEAVNVAQRTTNFTVGFGAGTPSVTGKVYAKAITGPDAGAASQQCIINGAATAYNCAFINGATPGTDSMRFFYDDAGVGVYSASFPGASATLTVAGPVAQVVLTPTSSSGAQNGYVGYTATATDAAGRPVTKTSVSLKATETNTDSADISVVAPPKPVPLTGAITPAAGATGSKTFATPTADGTGGTVAGVATFFVASRVIGTVNLTASSVASPAASANGTLTVNAGAVANDVAAVTIAPTAQRAYTGDNASFVVNLRNAQGNPVSGQSAQVTVSGANSGTQVSGMTDGDGNVTVTYPSANNGNDSVLAYVNQSNHQVNTTGLDSGEPSASATVSVAQSDLASIAANGPFTVPLSVSTTLITYTVVANNGASPAGYNVKFTTPVNAKFTLSATSAVTDAKGKASVTLTNSNTADGDTATVTGTAGFGGNVKTADSVVTYAASAVSANGLKIAPFANTTTVNGKASFSVSATDLFGNPVTGLTYSWSLAGAGRNNAVNNAGAVGSGATFTYTDVGAAVAEGQDTVTVQATDAKNVTTTATASQYWVTTPAKATQANLDFTLAGDYTENRTGVPFGQRGPIVGAGFTTKATAAVTQDPTAANPVTPTAVHVKLTDAANHRLYGKSVSFSSTGVGVFTDAQGNPVNSATALVADGTVVGQDNNYKGDPNGSVADWATTFVRSTQTGTQTITATVDGISTNATVTYSGQYVGITPVRVMDTRTGQGALLLRASAAPVGPLAPDTSYTLNYGTAGMPLGNPAYGAYVFNVTAINPSGVGNLRVAPGAGAVTPTTSLINYQSGKDVANSVIVSNMAGAGVNSLQLYSAASSANVAIDLVGYYPTGAGVTSTTPSRIADTRTGAGPVAAGETRSFQVAGQGGLPGTTAKAVALNVTVVNPSGLGNLRIFADGDAVPTTSNINYIPGQDKSAFVIVNLPANGKISVYSAGTPVDVAIDAYASYDTTASNLVTQTPVRILDTRPGNTLTTSEYINLQVAGNAGIPANAQAVLVSVTGIHTTGSTGSGNLRVYPSGATVPTISTLNYVSRTSDVANFAIVPIGANGKISIDSEGSPTDVAVDVLGYVPAGN